MSFLCYFAIFIDDPVPNDSNEFCILSPTGVTATEETSFVIFICVHLIKAHIEGGNCNYADKLLF